ncbi:MAG: protein kinase [Candidatus Sumerlaeia bacterium]|nr:protein kinase [Candidatus Sumerlaeia bacterium]
MFNLAEKYHITSPLFALNRYSAFIAFQRDFAREVIFNQIQLYYGDSSEILKDCKQEIKKWCSLQHLNLPEVIDGWSEEKRLVFIYLAPNGISLESIISRKESVEINQGIDIAIQLASLLHYLHQHNLYHGTLNPKCLTLHYEKWIKLIITGLPAQINRIFEQAETGVVQEINSNRLRCNDLISWGNIVGALFTGDPYFGYKKDLFARTAELDLTNLSLRQINPQVPEQLEFIVLKSLHSTETGDRGYSDFGTLLEDLMSLKQAYYFSRGQRKS